MPSPKLHSNPNKLLVYLKLTFITRTTQDALSTLDLSFMSGILKNSKGDTGMSHAKAHAQ
jgi:hypothetical protein